MVCAYLSEVGQVNSTAPNKKWGGWSGGSGEVGQVKCSLPRGLLSDPSRHPTTYSSSFWGLDGEEHVWPCALSQSWVSHTAWSRQTAPGAHATRQARKRAKERTTPCGSIVCKSYAYLPDQEWLESTRAWLGGARDAYQVGMTRLHFHQPPDSLSVDRLKPPE